EADALKVPEVGAGRTGINIDGIHKTLKLVKDKPVFAQCIGPFSLTGRLLDVNDAMVYCYEEPDMVHTVLKKATEFIINYAKAYKEAGAHGIIMAEPLAGILSPTLANEFSVDYCKKVVDEIQDDDFVVFYHNCGKEVTHQTDGIFSIGAKAYHFGDAIDMKEMMEKAPKDVLIMGNISPTNEFMYGTPASIRKATTLLLDSCTQYENFWLSSGCDIPPMTDIKNIEAFFEAAYEFRTRQNLFAELEDC
ncbi:MAG: methyltransferase, partial [Eggerthellaceae bacterium]|nr:methyltransferase [Eggerthellaceae bacterium]